MNKKKIYNLGKVKGRTPEFRLTEKLLEIKYDDETIWNTLVDFSTIASSFDLRLNEETLFLEAKRDVNAEWEQVADLSKLAKAHEHPNKDVLDKITSGVFKNISDAVSKRHTHENIDTINQITDEHIENIDKIPEIEEDVAELINNPTKQLVEGMFYTDETKKGLSANKNAVPTADNVWIEGNASNYHSFDELMSSATLNVVTSTSGKSTKTTVTIKIVCNDSDSASFVKNTLSGGGYHIGVVFEDTPDKTFYIKISSATISDTTVSVEFTFIDGQETFPITGNITRTIQSLYIYPKNGIGSHIEGLETIATGDYSHVQGKYNEIDTEGKYAHIVGNGTDDDNRSNAHTLDWDGNAWYAGSVSVADFKNSARTELESFTTDSFPSYGGGYLPMKIGSWYVFRINDIETMFRFKGGYQKVNVGKYTFSITPFSLTEQPIKYETSITGGTSGEIINYTLEALDLQYADLMTYINSLDTGLTEEQAADLVANTEARHTHENKDVLDTITEQTLTDINSNTEAISALTSDSKTEGSIEYKIAQAVSAIMENPDETMNSIQELVTWCNEHAEDAVALNNQVMANKEASHSHENKDILENFTENENGELLYRGEAVGATEETTYITPQMFGAVADGETDDTEAIQAALDQGGLIYFPAGRYKVTSLLTASKSCRIEMFKQYPNCYQTNDKGNYPLTDDDNWMGSRIETYSPDGGIVVGASAEIDGFYMRAMSGFSGVLFKFDEREGLFNYPGTVRLSHIRLDVSDRDTIPEAMFDFIPNGSYRYFLDDINIGRRHIEFCEYGFRADLSQVSETNWANDVLIRGLCVDCFADYPLYVDGAKRAAGWQFDGLTIQAYPYDTVASNGYGNGRTSHADIVTLKNLQETTFLSCYLWDLFQADYNNIFVTENITNTSCISCSIEFDEIESALSKQLEYPKNFTVKNLGVDVVTDPETGDNQLTLSDPAGNIQRVTIPAVALNDEQIDNAITNWMEEKSVPYEVVGKNKVNIASEDFVIGKIISSSGSYSTNANMCTTNYIEASYKDVIRMSKASYPVSGYNMACYDKDKNFLEIYSISTGNEYGVSPAAPEVVVDGTAYVRIVLTKNSTGDFTTLESNQFCITVNNPDVSYEPYEVRLEGGLGELIVLQSENGSRYSTAVTNDGKIVGKDSNGVIKSDYVTPQMFGAIGDGVTDDTAAVQAALDNGGTIYFPAGVYKVTKQLTTTKPCVIKMFKQYPSVFWRSGNTAGRYDYPLQIFEGESDYETEKGWDFGARLECYPSEGEQYGLLIGDGCEVDGLFMRAMDGFSGTLLAYDNSHAYGTDNLGDPITYTSYPSAARFKHIRLDCDRHHTETTIPESMFDFYPHGKYFYIFDDIVIGQQNEFATYGFRSIVDEEATWANSVRISNLCLNGLFDYPLYIVEENTKHSLTNWIFEGLSIQTYGYTYNEFEQAREGHKAVVTLKRMNYCMFSGCYIWDLYAAKYVKLFDCENLNNISCVGCSEEFYYGTKKLVGDDGEEGIETVLKGRLQEVADDANVKTLTMSTTTLEDGSNRIELTDNHGNTVNTDIPAVSLSDEQISTGVGDWMTENAAPVEVIGRNKLNIYSEDLVLAHMINAAGNPLQNLPYHYHYIVTPYIAAKPNDVFRASIKGVACSWSNVAIYDANYNFLEKINYADEQVGEKWTLTLTNPNTAFVRVDIRIPGLESEVLVTLEDVENAQLCFTLNDRDISYEPYSVELVGGLSQYFLLTSPNGTHYSVGVTDDGVIVGKDANGNIVGSTIPVKTSQLTNDSNYVTSAVTDELRISIEALQSELTGATATADEILETIGGDE